MEKAFGFSTHMQAGVSLIWSVGQLESELTFSPAQAVLDDEMIAYARRYERGIDVNDDTLALGVTRDVGIGGSFLDSDHTLANFRDELWEPTLLFRNRRETWDGRPLEEVAEGRADDLINAERTPCLTDGEEKAFLEIEKDFLARL